MYPLWSRLFKDRWIDVMENKGKRGGLTQSGGYDTNPYILLNWSSTLGDVYTLVHEMGHSMHSYFTARRSLESMVVMAFSSPRLLRHSTRIS